MSDEFKPLSQRIEIDDAADIVAVDGVRFSGELLRTILAGATPEGRWYQIADVRNGTMVVKCKDEVSHAG